MIVFISESEAIMKRYVIFSILLIIIVLTSCNVSTETNSEFEMDIPSVPPIENTTDITVSIQYIPVSSTGRQTNGQYKESWLEYIRNNYGLDMQIPSVMSRFDSYNGNAQEELLKQNSSKGLLAFPPTADTKLYELADRGLILPLTDILEENAVWNSLPSEMRSLYEYNGEIWAIPTGFSKTCYVRTVDKEFLDKFGMDVPETFEELREMFMRMTLDDPDGDGLDNTIGTDLSPIYVIDIFNNMNCFLQLADNKIQVTSIAYDKNKGKFVDCMLTDDISQPLNYIKGLVDDGIAELFRPPGVKALSYAYYTSLGTYGRELIWGYEGNNNNPIAINFNENFIAVAAGMDNAEEGVNKFVDVFFGNPEAYLCTQFGLPDEAFTINGNVEVIKNDFYENGMPSIVGFNPMIEDEIDYTGEHEYWLGRIGNDLAAELCANEDAFLLSADIAFAVKERTLFESATTKYGELVFGDELMGLFEYYYEQIMRGLMTVDEGVEAYRIKAKELGVEEYISELNSKYFKH